MPRYIALLRAINVGGHVVKMDRLRALFEMLGLTSVETLQAAGNVIFESRSLRRQDLAAKIQQHLQQELGYTVATLIRSDAELGAIANHRPFPASVLQTTGGTLYIGFMSSPPAKPARAQVLARRTDFDDFHIHKCEIYWLVRGRVSDSIFGGPLLEKMLGQPLTVRNSATVAKLVAKYPSRSAVA